MQNQLLDQMERLRIARHGLSNSHEIRVDLGFHQEYPIYEHCDDPSLERLLKESYVSDEDRLRVCLEFVKLWIDRSKKDSLLEFFSEWISKRGYYNDCINHHHTQLWGMTLTRFTTHPGFYQLRIWIEEPGYFTSTHVGSNHSGLGFFLLECKGPQDKLEIFFSEFARVIRMKYATKHEEIEKVEVRKVIKQL